MLHFQTSSSSQDVEDQSAISKPYESSTLIDHAHDPPVCTATSEPNLPRRTAARWTICS